MTRNRTGDLGFVDTFRGANTKAHIRSSTKQISARFDAGKMPAPRIRRRNSNFPATAFVDAVPHCALMKFAISDDAHVSRFARAGFASLLDALFPPRCGGCREWESEPFCPDCAAKLRPLRAPFCAMCGRPFDPLAKTGALCSPCRAHPHKFTAARAVFLFGEPIKTAIHRFKYFGYHSYAARLAPLMLKKWESDPTLSAFAPDFLAPVPLHSSRLRTRGFNQSALIARELGLARDVPLLELHRTRPTPPQVGLNAKARVQNVKGAFAVEHPALQGARVLLVDDVFTTGATLDECARALKKAGAGEICALTLARQAHPDEEMLVPPQRTNWELY